MKSTAHTSLSDLSKSGKRLKIGFFDYRDEDKDYIAKKLSPHEVVFDSEQISVKNIDKYKDLDVLSVFIYSQVSKEVISKMPNLKFVATRSTGYDHVDTAFCEAKSLKVANVPSYGENTVAEHAMALILGLARRLREASDRVRAGEFDPDGLTGWDLKGKVIGVVGTGHIGRNLINMALGFSMKVIAFDVYPDQKFAQQKGFEYVDMEYLFKKSDVISLHVPYLPTTHHLINKDSISKMKKGVVIINTSRGGLIETDALFDGLKSGQVGGAGLDVLEEETFIKEESELLYKDSHGKVDFKIALENHLMAYFPNVIITPHSAFNSKEAIMRILDTTMQNILDFASNKPQNLVGKKP